MKPRLGINRVAFWAPLLLPLFAGLVLAFTEFAVAIAQTAIAMEHGKDTDVLRLIYGDVSNLWQASSQGIAAAMFTVDIWALTTIVTKRDLPNATSIYAYPVFGFLLHFVLLLVIVSVGSLAGAFNAAANAVQLIEALGIEGIEVNSDIAQALNSLEVESTRERIRAIVAHTISTVMMLLSVVVAWYVRQAIWKYHDAPAIEADV